ncbi:hypothetical protein [Paludisphaera mucosa]|uniref:Uncharacterized protein n=1 Tax=Paludisphaera mucosa TaxID=3030827 RepID=A0ABT6F7A4_9BACT|nr:hypothetical protein [Paludisphaera mucosa]MDG3003472.1 hypothetical protein [Paludisphaera mucosa]
MTGLFGEVEVQMNTRNRMVLAYLGTREPAMDDTPSAPCYRVGELYIAGRTTWPEGSQYGYGPHGHELTIFTPDPSDEVVAAVRRGEARFAISVSGPIFFLAYRFGAEAGWRDVPYSWHLQHREARATPPLDPSPESRALLWISLVDSTDGLVLAQRGVTLSPAFTRTLHRTIRDQASSHFDPLECTLTVAEASRERPEAADRLRRATAWSKGNS